MPELTVILPCFDCERWVRRALDSLFAQTVSDWTLVVVDDAGSRPEELAAILRDYRDPRLVALRTTVNVGQFRIYNRLLPSVTSPYLGFQDADDWSEPHRFEVQLEALAAGRCDAIGSHLVRHGEDGVPLGMIRPPEDVGTALAWRCRGGVLFGSTLVCRTALARRLGGWDGTTRFGADSDFAYRAVFAGRLGNHPQPLYHYTDRAGSLTRSPLYGFGTQARRAYRRRIRRRFYRRLLARRLLGSPGPLAAAPNDLAFELVPLE